MDKAYASAEEAVADIASGSSIAVGGFGLVGVPVMLIRALKALGADRLEVISNNCGVDDWGLGELLSTGQIKRMIASYVGENKEFARQYLSGQLELEFSPQGTPAERLRSGGAGIPAFYTASGVGTLVADGGLPWRYDQDGNVVKESPKKETRVLDMGGEEKEYVLEKAIVADFALVRAANAGGISEVRRIASMAEAYNVSLAPHCSLGPIALAASLQVGATSANLLIQEQSLGIHYNTESDLLDYLVDPSVFRYRDGYVDVPTGCGLGIEVDQKEVERLASPVWHRDDGSLAEW